jgi:hypothetical protein
MNCPYMNRPYKGCAMLTILQFLIGLIFCGAGLNRATADGSLLGMAFAALGAWLLVKSCWRALSRAGR